MSSRPTSKRFAPALLALVFLFFAAAYGPSLWAGWGDVFKKVGKSLDKKRNRRRRRRRGAHNTKAHAAVRGANCSSREVEEAKGRSAARDFNALERLEAMTVSESEVETFARQGGLDY